MHHDFDLSQDSDQPVVRQVQFGRRRHTISIEPIYWGLLEDIAHQDRLRLNQLVGRIAAAPQGPDNLAARLRLYCVRRLKRRLEERENSPATIGLAQIVEASPGPCFVMSQQLTIVWHNALFRDWLGLEPADIGGISFAKHFRLKLSRSMADMRRDFPASARRVETGTLTCLLSGRVFARHVSVCLIPLQRPYSFVWLVSVSGQGGGDRTAAHTAKRSDDVLER